MNRTHKGLIIALVACIGLWGCAQESPNSAAQSEKIRKLDKQLQEANAAREEAGNRLTSLERERTQLQRDKAELVRQLQNLRAITQERDELKVQLNSRTAERDGYVSQLEELRKGLKTLLGRADAALNPGANASSTGQTNPGL